MGLFFWLSFLSLPLFCYWLWHVLNKVYRIISSFLRLSKNMLFLLWSYYFDLSVCSWLNSVLFSTQKTANILVIIEFKFKKIFLTPALETKRSPLFNKVFPKPFDFFASVFYHFGFGGHFLFLSLFRIAIKSSRIKEGVSRHSWSDLEFIESWTIIYWEPQYARWSQISNSIYFFTFFYQP